MCIRDSDKGDKADDATGIDDPDVLKDVDRSEQALKELTKPDFGNSPFAPKPARSPFADMLDRSPTAPSMQTLQQQELHKSRLNDFATSLGLGTPAQAGSLNPLLHDLRPATLPALVSPAVQAPPATPLFGTLNSLPGAPSLPTLGPPGSTLSPPAPARTLMPIAPVFDPPR